MTFNSSSKVCQQCFLKVQIMNEVKDSKYIYVDKNR